MPTIDEEFAALLDEHYRIACRNRTRNAKQEYIQKMLDVCRRIRDNRMRGGAEQGYYYWARQVKYWEKET